MKFDLLYELQMPKPHDAWSEYRCYHEALAQIELADRLGFDTVWEVEHHFLTEFAHSSAPEVFLSAVAQRTKRIRIGHGVVLLPHRFNHPIRVAERERLRRCTRERESGAPGLGEHRRGEIDPGGSPPPRTQRGRHEPGAAADVRGVAPVRRARSRGDRGVERRRVVLPVLRVGRRLAAEVDRLVRRRERVLAHRPHRTGRDARTRPLARRATVVAYRQR